MGANSTHSDFDNIKVFFGRRSALKREIPPNSVLIVPYEGDWNDFGYRTLADFQFNVTGTTSPVEARGYIGSLTSGSETPNTSFQFRTLVSSLEDDFVEATAKNSFFTMLTDMKAYRNLVQMLEPEKAQAFLFAINDLVAHEEFNTQAKWLNDVPSLEVFHRSFMRNAETFYAYKNAGPILRGLQFEEIGKLSHSFAIKFQLPGRQNEHKLKFDFENDEILPKRISIIIGKNGVGKSQTLRHIVNSAQKNDGALTDGQGGERPLINRILAFAPTNEAESVFPTDTDKNHKVWYRRFSLNRSRRSRRNAYVTDTIIQLARSDQHIGERSRWEIFLSSLKAINTPEQLCLEMKSEVRKHIPIKDLVKGSEQYLLDLFGMIDVQKDPIRLIDGKGYPLSSGEITFIKFASQASLHIENGSLLLMDEPETHLHPNFISQFVDLLNRILSQTGSAAIIATHSVYFLREAFRDQITVLHENSEGLIVSERPTLRTFGADIGAISYFVFGEDEETQLSSNVERKLVESKMPWEKIFERYKDELSLEILSSIKAAIEEKNRDQ